ncbi:ArsR/SmtB family transcription factor [Paraliomyxa miuraensis]|uniref:ArsR/SmtB family transcription factor n=1 Tax=Paraliomyxa miuraensis TaxID=376150 RepID=UPI002253F8A6|nr:metalloregulator ArsR/SmtB family transcription factor [Paraliomyxa miuraensis]MCX4239899.1 metalloregulator ArsR/SmtB family transcription factor [Paraliomyxa miuraensis]
MTTRLRVVEECRPSGRRKPRELRSYAGLLKALGDETRLEIVGLLAAAGQPLCACDIESHFDLAQPTISHHLKVLRKAGWLGSERRGTWVFYDLDREAVSRLEGLVTTLRR